MTADTPAQRTAGQDDRAPERPDGAPAVLRYVPPAAALGTAFVLQVIAITDTVGGMLADRYGTDWLYAAGAVLGLSVASCAEGGAAYLMDLYDKHLLARDSVWVLRLAMVGYVAASAGAIHWWLSANGLPTIISWLLAGMSASALFLYSRGSRWRNRAAMRAAGQLDPALPRLPMAAKIMHPVRWLITLYLISWEPVATTGEARARYEQWRAARRSQRHGRTRAAGMASVVAAAPDRPVSPVATPAGRSPVRLVSSDRGRATVRGAAGEVSIDVLADTLDRLFPDRVPGRPTALPALRAEHGACSTGRAIEAITRLSARRNGGQRTDSTDGQERVS